MSPLEVILSFTVVMTVLSTPIVALITRKNSPIGQAIGDRIRAKTRQRYPEVDHESVGGRPSGASRADSRRMAELEETVENQNAELAALESKLSFLSRLIEEKSSTDMADK